MSTPSQSIRTYIRAKDENRPHLMRRVFAPTAVLEMAVETEAVSFPPLSKGLDAITDVLIRDFGQTYENVYTFCLAAPPTSDDRRFSCDWLVGMSRKSDGAVLVGRGRYDWLFQTDDRSLAEKLTITIESMQVLPADSLDPVMDWLSALPYPWCSVEAAAKSLPNIEGLAAIAERLARPPRRQANEAAASS